MVNETINVVDIGARYGIHPSWKGVECKINFNLFETDKLECQILKKKYLEYKNVKIFNKAVSNNKKPITINQLTNPAMSTSKKRLNVSPLFWGIRKNQLKIENKYKVSSVTLNDVFVSSGYIDFIKIDTEGSEFEILEKYDHYNELLGIRSEVNFTNVFQEEDNKDSFSKLNELMLSKKFILLNLDYNGQGEPFLDMVDLKKRYGILQTTDAVWIKNLDQINKMTPINKLKLSVFLFKNNAPDIAIWILKSLKLYEIKKLLKLDIFNFLKFLTAKHLYSIKWQSNQNNSNHKKIFEKIFQDEYPELNKYNESLFYNRNII
ncbi:FkbM family methyltransferase [Alphaproteobacteria bacterium]|nr:FkbM family methyltransferase [Alphaproteobacteria bacterium]